MRTKLTSLQQPRKCVPTSAGLPSLVASNTDHLQSWCHLRCSIISWISHKAFSPPWASQNQSHPALPVIFCHQDLCLLLRCPGWITETLFIYLPNHLLGKLQRAQNSAAHIVFRRRGAENTATSSPAIFPGCQSQLPSIALWPAVWKSLPLPTVSTFQAFKSGLKTHLLKKCHV